MSSLKDYLNEGAFESWIDSEPYRPSAKKKKDFYYSPIWRDLRAKVLDRYGKQCSRCGKVTKSPHVDHIKPRAIYPKLELVFSNLQVLCKDCNYRKGSYTIDYRKVKHKE